MAEFGWSGESSVFLLTLLCASILYVFFKLWWKPLRIQRFMLSQGVRGPPYNFIYGNNTQIMKMKMESMTTSLHITDHNILPRVDPHIHSWINKYGRNYLEWNGNMAELVVSDPETIKDILYNRERATPKITLTGLATRIFGDGLSTSQGEKWAKARRIADNAFHGELLKSMVPTMVSCAEVMVEKWQNQLPQHKEVDLFEEFKVLTSDIIAHTAFGSSYLEGKFIFESLNQLCTIMFQNQFKRRIPRISKLFGSKDGKVGEELERQMKSCIVSIMKKREEKVRNGEADDYGNDFLGLLLKAKNESDQRQRISEDDVIDECKTIYFAGQETTSVVISWAAFLLATHLHWQEEARKEVFNVFGNKNPTLEGLSKLKIMSMIIKETLRLYPPTSPMARDVKKEIRLGKLVVPANIQVSISTVAVQHNTAIWGEDAHEFKPERFSERTAKDIPLGAYIPFGWGPRNCVGNTLATNEIKIVLSMILQRFSFTISPTYVHAPYLFVTICPQHGVQVKLQSLAG